MKRLLCVLSILFCIVLCACGNAKSVGIIGGADGPTAILVTEKGESGMYQQITQKEAKTIMDSGKDYILLDVRE